MYAVRLILLNPQIYPFLSICVSELATFVGEVFVATVETMIVIRK